ncbi:MAG: Slp family lipoprotein [Syntrophotaleaceae bacterium]
MKNLLTFFGLLIMAALLAGCGSVLSEDALSRVNYAVDYPQIKANPDRHVGKTLILGGMILENNVSNEGTTLEILKYTLDDQDNPENPDEPMGRFLAKTSRLLDPSVYESGRLVTMTGTLTGTEVKPLQKANYTYPVFEIEELVLVPERTYRDYYYPYYPYYYDPFYWRYPYWHRYPYWW